MFLYFLWITFTNCKQLKEKSLYVMSLNSKIRQSCHTHKVYDGIVSILSRLIIYVTTRPFQPYINFSLFSRASFMFTTAVSNTNSRYLLFCFIQYCPSQAYSQCTKDRKIENIFWSIDFNAKK